MSSALEINGKKLLLIKDAVRSVPYSKDHITRLAREGKIIARQIGRQWYVELSSLKNYADFISHEQEIRQRELSEIRKQERLVREAIENQTKLQSQKVALARTKARLFVGSVLVVGFVFGLVILQSKNQTVLSSTQLASTQSAVNEGGEAAKLNQIEFAHTYRRENFVNDQTGVLLLPDVSTSTITEMEAYFSDRVQVQRTEDGRMFIEQIDSQLNPEGEKVPLLLVPVQTTLNSE